MSQLFCVWLCFWAVILQFMDLVMLDVKKHIINSKSAHSSCSASLEPACYDVVS